MRIAVVANGEPRRDFSSEIDSHDLVIRFNLLNYLKKNSTGKKTDVIGLRTFRNFKEILARVLGHKKELEAYLSCSEILLVYDYEQRIQYPGNHFKDLNKALVELRGELVKIQLVPAEYLGDRGLRESTGFAVLKYIRTKYEDLDTEINLFCFNYEFNNDDHEHSAEQIYVRGLGRKGELNFIPNK